MFNLRSNYCGQSNLRNRRTEDYSTGRRHGILADFPTNTGFPKKDARFSNFKNIPYLHCDDKEGKIM